MSNDGGRSLLINNTNVIRTENIEVRTFDSFNIKMNVEDNKLNEGASKTLKQLNYSSILFYFILFYFILFYFILFYFILFYFILFYFILFYFILFIN